MSINSEITIFGILFYEIVSDIVYMAQYIMEYSFDIFDKNPERLATILAENCRKRRLDRGLSRRSLSEITGIPEPTLERFETQGKISLEAFLKLVVEFGWFDEMSAIMGKSKFTTGEELETINKNRGRQKGR